MDFDAIFSDLAKSVPGFTIRPQQVGLAGHVATIAEHSVAEGSEHPLLAVEAPTGVGKTLGYLVGSLAVVESDQHKLVIATATTNLQGQILNRDLPLLFGKDGHKVRYALAKGRGRFVCKMRLAEKVAEGQQQTLLDSVLASSHREMLRQLEAGSWSGDLDHWPEQLTGDQTRQITNTREGCTGKRCSMFDDCSFYQMREKVMNADVLVTNHALLLQDLVLGGGVILPPPENSFYLVDEAHRLHASARTAFAGRSDLAALKKLGEELAQLLNKLSSLSPSTKQLSFAEINRGLQEMTRIAETLEGELLSNGQLLDAYQNNQLEHRLPNGHPWRIALQIHGKGLVSLLATHYKLMNKVGTLLQDDFDARNLSENLFHRFMPMVGATINELTLHWQCWNLLMQQESPGEPPIARWISLAEGEQGLHVVLNTTPISVAESLRTLFWEKATGTVLTSATLRTLGNFDLLTEQLGLDRHPVTRFEVLDSPFDYSRATVSVPRMEYTPAQPKRFQQELAERLGQEIDPAEGTLVLFTSHEMMKRTYAALSPELGEIALVQGAGVSPEEMVRLHRQRIDNGKGSLLMGLNRFAEGVDLPGKLCTHVVIPRLPFPYFNGAVDKTESEWLESMGMLPFLVRSLPVASMRLTQMAGRLLRTEQDHGRITILDNRILTRRYGEDLLRNLPPYRRTFRRNEQLSELLAR